MDSAIPLYQHGSPTDSPRVRAVTLIAKDSSFDHRGVRAFHTIGNLEIDSITDVRVGKLYLFDGYTNDELQTIEATILGEATHLLTFRDAIRGRDIGSPSQYVCVAYKPQVTNPEVESLKYALRCIGIDNEDKYCQTAEIYLLFGDVTDEQRRIVEREIVNPSIQTSLRRLPESLAIVGAENDRVERIDILRMAPSELVELSQERRLFLNQAEMIRIQQHFASMERVPTDCELEILAQAWSEHCGHKTFKAQLVINGEKKRPLYDRLKQSTYDIAHPDVVSCFIDNSGVVRFDDVDAVCIKAETHSAPAAIEPFGGAETGVGGVIRDILGTGLGARPISVFDVLCFGNLDTDDVLPGCLHPRHLLREVVAGVSSYGNKVGLPNTGGAVVFDAGFRAKPVVLAGSVGLIPVEKAAKGLPRPGDCILVIGGRTGRDGIHGATFSSGSMTDKTKDIDSTAVQIGYPVLKRKVIDILARLFAEDQIHALTDCGGGGLSSAITEICAGLGGTVQLDRLTTKYNGLAPWELFLSESQERMVLALAPDVARRASDLCERYQICADMVGTFNDGDNLLTLKYENKLVAELDLEFVLNGNPLNILIGSYRPPLVEAARFPAMKLTDVLALGTRVLQDLNVCSKESIVRAYDHTVTGTLQGSPYSGLQQDAPQDGVVIRPKYDSHRGLIITHGLAPEIGRHDPYEGAVASVVEAIANGVARGGDPKRAFLIDNFVHPRPNNPLDIGTLDRSLEGIVAAARAFGTPFVSGKDSLGSTYEGRDGTVVKAAPTVVVTALFVLEDSRQTVPSHFLETGSHIVLVGSSIDTQLGGSVAARLQQLETNDVPQMDLAEKAALFTRINSLIVRGDIVSCHDVKDGGVFAALSEMTLGANIGVVVEVDRPPDEIPAFLFNETSGRFVVEVSSDANPRALFEGIAHTVLGGTRDTPVLCLKTGAGSEEISIANLRKSCHNRLLEEIIHLDPAPLPAAIKLGAAPTRKPGGRPIRPKALIIKAPGTNSEAEMAGSFEHAGADTTIVDIRDLESSHFGASQIVGIPGGFSYGDDISAGKIFAIELATRFKDEILRFVEADKLVLGICNGFQVLVRAGLLPRRRNDALQANLLHNEVGGFVCRRTKLLLNDSVCKWTAGLQGRVLEIPTAHGEGRFFAHGAVLDELREQRQVACQYVDAHGQPTQQRPDNPNGSADAIAGLTDPTGRILGMMPHPERDPANFAAPSSENLIGLDILKTGVGYFL